MELREEHSSSTLTLPSISNQHYEDDQQLMLEQQRQYQLLPSASLNGSNYLVANSPPYSPASGGVFTFFTPSQSPMIRTGNWRGRSRITIRRLFNYATYSLTCGMIFVCFLLLEASCNERISNEIRSRSFETRINSDSQSDKEKQSINRNSRFRRALLIKNDQRHEMNIMRDGPLFDLGDGYAATRGDDVVITVKTSKKYHASRLNDILDTWFRLAPEQIYFVTDADDENLNARLGGRLIPTTCPAGHHRHALCCKQAVEYETYLKHGRSWWCHFDDDNYVNVPQLMRTLSQYDPRQDWYLGKPSTKGPIETPLHQYASSSDGISSTERTPFWFATGGAGFCISKSLAMKMRPYAANGKFVALCDRIRLPDDVTIGFLIEVLLEKNLTVVSRFHSHLENMRSIETDRLHEQVTLSAGSYDGRDRNLVNVDKFFPDADDPRRFRSIHCHLYPMAAVCRSRKER